MCDMITFNFIDPLLVGRSSNKFNLLIDHFRLHSIVEGLMLV